MEKNKNVSVNVEYLTRVEGHGNIVVNVKNGEMETCQLQIVEAPRFFEGMLRGRSIFEAQHITSRICGICACAHSLVSIQAAEAALGFTPSAQTIALRKLLLHMEIFDSHILHLYLLTFPDLLGVKSFLPLINTNNQIVRRALRMKKACNDVCEILVGRHVHPISAVVGGFTQLPTEEKLDSMLKILYSLRPELETTLELAATFHFLDFERDTEYLALANDSGEYPLLSGDIVSTDGERLPKTDYKKITNEFIVPYSSGKHARFNRQSYMVGALARFNNNAEKLHPKARSVAKTLGLKSKNINPFLNTNAQLVECFHCLEESIKILEDFKLRKINYDEAIIPGLNEKGRIPVKAGSGIGTVEAPRGLLFHQYEIDDKGIIINANCVIPTAQNLENIEQDMRKLVPEIINKTGEEITLTLEMLVRAYDPCISCSAHFLDVKFVGR